MRACRSIDRLIHPRFEARQRQSIKLGADDCLMSIIQPSNDDIDPNRRAEQRAVRCQSCFGGGVVEAEILLGPNANKQKAKPGGAFLACTCTHTRVRGTLYRPKPVNNRTRLADTVPINRRRRRHASRLALGLLPI